MVPVMARSTTSARQMLTKGTKHYIMYKPLASIKVAIEFGNVLLIILARVPPA